MMSKLLQTPLLTKIIVCFSCVCFLLYIIAIGSPYWMKTRKTLPASPPDTLYPVLIRLHLGLYRACLNAKSFTPDGILVIEDWCRSKNAPDWHKICALLGGLAFMSGLAEVVIAMLSITLKRVANGIKVKLAMAGFSVLAAGFMIPVLIMFNENRSNYKGFHFDLYYDYVLATIAMVFYFLLALLIPLDIYWNSFRSEDAAEERLWTDDKNGEDRYT
ncbi:hypothetical protein PoB_006188300 [Plakobranchus ocellatus]|uniref:Uncharacterized protein n=1 Tax=Plakobranchus ocellatus TaxID=259542 RepID=A0AAV4CU51_9GAST|nr:hypothetical protein PoB_006188300 [Plakobranchus ocellatus]